MFDLDVIVLRNAGILLLETPEQLQDPHLADAERILRRCVHCGLCTATCSTYVVLGDERDSPRGRIYLMKDMFEKGREASPEVQFHVDRWGIGTEGHLVHHNSLFYEGYAVARNLNLTQEMGVQEDRRRRSRRRRQTLDGLRLPRADDVVAGRRHDDD